MKSSVMKKIDPSKIGVIQTGFVDGGPPPKQEEPKEELTPRLEIEKLVYKQILRDLVPDFPVKKLEKQSLADIRRFFAEISPLIQEEVLEIYKNISP